MIEHPNLQTISAARASLTEAAEALELALKEDVGREIYDALRDWTWKAIHSKRLDDELEDWLGLIDGVAVRLPDSREGLRTALSVLSDLLGISIRFAASVSDEELLRYSHVPQILLFVAGRNDYVSRQDLKAEFPFHDSRLSQLLTTLISAGFLDREPRGREAHFALTRRGSDMVEKIRERAAADARAGSGMRTGKSDRPVRHRVPVPSSIRLAVAARPSRSDRPAGGTYVQSTRLSGGSEDADRRSSFHPPLSQVVAKEDRVEGR